MNENGLTWAQWYAAATCYHNKPKKISLESLKAAWRAGECPEDYAAEWTQTGVEKPMTGAVRRLTLALGI